MPMSKQYSSLDGVFLRNTWLTIGSFDGVHLGHQHLIKELTQHAHLAGGKSVVLTFHPHPATVVRGRTGAFYLTTPQEKISLITDLGADYVITYPFTFETSQSSASEFTAFLSEHLGFQELWVGTDFALGRNREGNVAFLQHLGEQLNFRVNPVEPILSGGKTISSSRIRNTLAEGHITEVNALLGRTYQVSGAVIHGDGRGKTIGIPTANLETGSEKLIPAAGVYACRAIISGKIWPAAVNIGTRPTFDVTDHTSHVEAHILDFSEDLYSQVITLEFIAWLRGEERFGSVDELIRYIRQDIDQTRRIVGAYEKSVA